VTAFRLTFALVGALSVATVVAAPQSDPPRTVDEAVKACVDAVHATKVGEMERSFFREFDAYYNPATQLVENNAYRGGDRPPLYAFNKCMVQKGFPLGRKADN
jgi:hypothetical protein